MFETLYKTAKPTNFKDGEYYQPDLKVEFRNGVQMYFVREKHGYWDETKKKMANQTVTLDPEEGFTDFAEAKRRYERQVEYRASQGFVHSFSIDFEGPDPVKYRRLLLIDCNYVNSSKTGASLLHLPL
jgi:hypothetical protein